MSVEAIGDSDILEKSDFTYETSTTWNGRDIQPNPFHEEAVHDVQALAIQHVINQKELEFPELENNIQVLAGAASTIFKPKTVEKITILAAQETPKLLQIEEKNDSLDELVAANEDIQNSIPTDSFSSTLTNETETPSDEISTSFDETPVQEELNSPTLINETETSEAPVQEKSDPIPSPVADLAEESIVVQNTSKDSEKKLSFLERIRNAITRALYSLSHSIAAFLFYLYKDYSKLKDKFSPKPVDQPSRFSQAQEMEIKLHRKIDQYFKCYLHTS